MTKQRRALARKRAALGDALVNMALPRSLKPSASLICSGVAVDAAELAVPAPPVAADATDDASAAVDAVPTLSDDDTELPLSLAVRDRGASDEASILAGVGRTQRCENATCLFASLVTVKVLLRLADWRVAAR